MCVHFAFLYHIVIVYVRITINSLHLLGACFVPGTTLSALLVLSYCSSQQPCQVETIDERTKAYRVHSASVQMKSGQTTLLFHAVVINAKVWSQPRLNSQVYWELPRDHC